jgi:hypothetical protein
MARWKRLTGTNSPIDVNLDLIGYMLPNKDGFTELYFASGYSEQNGEQFVTVRETPDEIHMTIPLGSF